MAVAADTRHETLAGSGMNNHALAGLAGHPDNPVNENMLGGKEEALGQISSSQQNHLLRW
ncbi:MAG: hypothetical protein ABW201_13045 [Candidatus Thiodiazotropha sp.]